MGNSIGAEECQMGTMGFVFELPSGLEEEVDARFPPFSTAGFINNA